MSLYNRVVEIVNRECYNDKVVVESDDWSIVIKYKYRGLRLPYITVYICTIDKIIVSFLQSLTD